MIASIGPIPTFAVGSGSGSDIPILRPGAEPLEQDDEEEARLLLLDQAFIASRTAGDNQLSVQEAGALRAAAANAAKQLKSAPPAGPTTFNSPWEAIGPDPLSQSARSSGALKNVSGRIGALAIRKNGQFILGAAQGGIWLFNPATNRWTNQTDNLPSLSTGALVVAPSNDLIVYDGTGEGALSGDSYFGNGILKSTDGGVTWAHVSGDFFLGVSISRLAVDPANANHVYAAVLRGRGGARRVSPPIHSAYGLWESTDGGVSWTLIKAAPSVSLGATDLRIDPQNPQTLYASFWSDAIYKSTDGGATWSPIMTGLPTDADYAAGLTRFALSISHPVGQPAVLYTGFDWIDTAGVHHAGRIFRSANEGASWSVLPTGSGANSVLDYCTSQCFYDNVVEADPTNSDVLFVAGSFGYNLSPQSGGIYRSLDAGQTWKNMGWDQHPDFHALAFDPNNSNRVLIGSDGGVWFSSNRGGRLGAADPLSAVDWQDMNVGGLQITQFTSIATNPTRQVRIWGGSQDNGTERKAAATTQWFDLASGDGGQVLVDPTDSTHIYGTYFGISPYRFTDSGDAFFTNQSIANGINLADRSEFYTPFTMNQRNVNQLFLGTYRLYRTDNAKAFSAGDVRWTAISPDLTSGCTGAAPNGARNCTLSAIGVGGGTAVYTGSLDGYVYVSTDAQVNNNSTWTRVGLAGGSAESNGNGSSGLKGNATLPRRPVGWIAVDRSDYRIAYIAYNGYNASTPHQPGHVFKTANGGASWTDISGNLPDNPVNSIILDPAYPNTLYAATDVGPFVTFNGGASWSALGTSGFPIVAVDQIDLDPTHRLMAAGTHGRGAFRMTDTSAPAPALVLSKVDAGVPVGPGSNINYTITVQNIGNGNATGVTITDPIPANTTFVSADSGGVNSAGTVTWSGKAVASGASISVHLTVQISSTLKSKTASIIDDGYKVTSTQGAAATGSPTVTPIAPPYAVSLSPASQTGGAHVGQSVKYTVTIKNLGYKTDSYSMTSSGGTYAVTLLDSTCATTITTTPSVIAGGTTDVCVKVDVPAGASSGDSSTSTITATSVASPSVSASGTVKTIAVTVDTLLVDGDGNAPNVQSYYTAALTGAGVQFTTWDLATDPNLPPKFMTAFKTIVWFTGNSYPGPITPYEAGLTAYLDGGGHLFVSGQDLLDQGAGTTNFVHNYLHVTWDGTENQNDKATANVHGVTTSPLTATIGTVPLDTTVLGNSFMDEITPNGGALTAFTDDATQPDALTFTGAYKVVFLAFPFEEYGTASDKSSFVSKVMTFFGP
ncbi:MAG TPA: hypothetical protein VNG70_12935 [Candidatus Limnocylindria bacterium]|nr:hypothetical protein [Candidatus Limnocylindria bacterium]